MKLIIWLLYSAVVVYSLLDGVQTIMLLNFGAQEANPFLAWLIEKTGTPYSIFYVKTLALVYLLVLLIIYLDSSQKSLAKVVKTIEIT